MKKRIFGLFIIATVMLAAALSFSSCGNNSFYASGFTIGETLKPTVNYNGHNDTTEVTIYVKVTNQTRVTVDSFSFFAQFRDCDGRILESRICKFDIPLASGESKGSSYDFKSTDTSDAAVIRGKVDFVTYSPCSMQVAGISGASEVATGKEPPGAFEIFIIVLGIIFCLAVAFIGILLIYNGVEDAYGDGGGWIAAGIALIVAAVIFGITFIVLT